MEKDSYSIMRAVASLDLPSSAKLVALVMAMHFNRASQTIVVKRETLCRETSLTLRTVKTALKILRDELVFEGRRTGRATVYAVGKKVEIWMVQNMPHQRVQNLPHRVTLEDTDSPGEARYKQEMLREWQEKTGNFPKPKRIRRERGDL